jgi:hypothetical protein
MSFFIKNQKPNQNEATKTKGQEYSLVVEHFAQYVQGPKSISSISKTNKQTTKKEVSQRSW